MVVVERYPDLKATQAFRDLQVAAGGDREPHRGRAHALRRGGAGVQQRAQHVPDRDVIASAFGSKFAEKAYFKAQAGAETAPKSSSDAGSAMTAMRRRGRVVAVALARRRSWRCGRGRRAGGRPRRRSRRPRPAFVTDRAGFLSAPFSVGARRAAGGLRTRHRPPGDRLRSIARRAACRSRTGPSRRSRAGSVGRKGHDDGVAMFIFSDDHRMRIEVGYGLEDNVPDARAGRIIDERHGAADSRRRSRRRGPGRRRRA